MILSQSNSLSEDIDEARKEGFSSDFMYREGHLWCRTHYKKYKAKECILVEYCRHEGMNDPGDSSILFLIACTDGIKGCLSSAYGVDADTELIEFVQSLAKKKS